MCRSLVQLSVLSLQIPTSFCVYMQVDDNRHIFPENILCTIQVHCIFSLSNMLKLKLCIELSGFLTESLLTSMLALHLERKFDTSVMERGYIETCMASTFIVVGPIVAWFSDHMSSHLRRFFMSLGSIEISLNSKIFLCHEDMWKSLEIVRRVHSDFS